MQERYLKDLQFIFMGVHMTKISLDNFKTLKNKITWGTVEAQFVLDLDYPKELVSNVSIVPIVGDHYVIIKLKNGKYELPGGTLEPGESLLNGLTREVTEEVGSQLINYNIVGYFLCRNSSEKPYRPHIPHPKFVRLFGYGEVKIEGRPTNPTDGEQVDSVEVVSIEQAIERLERDGRYDIADLYRIAHEAKSNWCKLFKEGKSFR